MSNKNKSNNLHKQIFFYYLGMCIPAICTTLLIDISDYLYISYSRNKKILKF